MVQDDNSMVLGNNSFLDIKSGFDNTHAKEENRPMKVSHLTSFLM